MYKPVQAMEQSSEAAILGWNLPCCQLFYGPWVKNNIKFLSDWVKNEKKNDLWWHMKII